MSPIVNRRNALLGWATWVFIKQAAQRRARQAIQEEPPRRRRWVRRAGAVVAAALAALGLAAVLRKLRGGSEDEWTAFEPGDVETISEPAPLSSVEPDDDIPPAA